MAVARYWRVTGLQVPGGADLELSRLHLMGSGGRVDASAALVASIAPIAGAVVALRDGDDLTLCRFAGASVRAAGFALTWDLGASGAAQVTALEIQGPKVRNAPERAMLLRSDDGVAWTAEVADSLVTTAAYDGELVSCSTTVMAGRLLASAAAYSGNGNPSQALNVAATGTPTWQGNYAATAAIGAFSYLGTASAPAIAPRVSKTVPFFLAESWAVSASNGSYYGDYANLDVEFLAGETVVAALSVRRAGEFFNGVFYGPSLASLTAAPRYGSYPQTNGIFTFAANKIIFTENLSSQNTYSFEYARDLSQVTAIRIAVEAMATYSSGGAAQMTLRLQNNARMGAVRADPIQSMVRRGLFAATSDVPRMRHQRIASPLLARDMEFGGTGRITGTVAEKGTPNLPLRRRVRLHRDVDGLCVRETWSDATTGAYEFTDINPAYRYTAIAYDYAHNHRAVAADNLTPEVLP